jgi:hypothetical protein
MERDGHTLERVQKRAVNMVNGLAGKSYEEKLSELKLVGPANRGRLGYDV